MTEREMLEWAAKAAGFSWWRSKHGHIKLVLPGGESLDCCTGWPAYDSHTEEKLPTPEFADALIEHGWTPLTDDGDAFRLAVKLDLNVMPGIVRSPSGFAAIEYSDDGSRSNEECTRLAITRAAAEIGKAAGKKGDV